MLEKIKEIPLIDQSRAVKLLTANGKLLMERNDRVIWAAELTKLEVANINCYVEADKFFNLLPNIQTLTQTTCLEIALKNGARYDLPFMQVEWESEDMPENYSDTITFKLDDLMLCTLKNLVKPELQCIYIDGQGAVSCDFVSACLSNQVRSQHQILLPPDVQELVNGRQCLVQIENGKMYFKASDFFIATAVPQIGEDRWWEDLRAMIPQAIEGKPVTSLVDSLKRLQLFGDYVTFSNNKANVGENYEPFEFIEEMSTNNFEIERLSKILTTAVKIDRVNENLMFANETSRFLLSPMEEI